MGFPRVLIRVSVTMMLVGLSLAASDLTASAASCVWTGQDDGTSYKCVAPGRQHSIKPPTAPTGRQTPSCDLKSLPLATFCSGSFPCYDTYSVSVLLPPATKPPAPDSKWHTQLCFNGTSLEGTVAWDAQASQPPPLVDRARVAKGRIALPEATLEFNPTARTLVNLDTWFWADGLTRDERRGTPAFGLVAIATPDRLEITPGDGSDPFTCAWVTAKSGRCVYPYRHSSVGGPLIGANGRPAYQASGRATWTLRFEDNGVPVTIPGAPTEISGPRMTSAVEVTEVQTLVTDAG